MTSKKVTSYTHLQSEITEPETGHTKLLPDEKVHTLDMDPRRDPELYWAGKIREKKIPVLPLQRNEIVTESMIAQIVERVQEVAKKKSGQVPLTNFIRLEKALRVKERSRRVEFYRHEERWRNKLISGDSLLVMESLLNYENLRGKVQMIYMDPPYAVKYDTNFQQRVDSTKNDDKDRSDDVLTIKAFNDTWVLGIHSYLSYLQERLYLCRELLSETGSIFVQINQENEHLVRTVLDEVFGKTNFISTIIFAKTSGQSSTLLAGVFDLLLWYGKNKEETKFNPLYLPKEEGSGIELYRYIELPNGERRRLTKDEIRNPGLIPKGRLYRISDLSSQGETSSNQEFKLEGKTYLPSKGRHWTVPVEALNALVEKNRIVISAGIPQFVRYINDFPVTRLTNLWTDTATGSFTERKVFVVQTSAKVVSRCIQMSTDPGDIVFDPTCGSGVSALSAEKWGRRWITCDISRVAINITRKSLLTAVFKHYKTKNGGVSSGFIYKRISRITPKSIAYGQEPESVELVNDPDTDKSAVRVTGPFEVMSVGRYSVDDWKGFVNQGEKLENYINVICRLYMKDAAIQGASGYVHAIVDIEGQANSVRNKIAISVGPLSGRVTAKQISDAVEDALASGINEVHILGWSFEANVGEIKSRLESRGKIKVNLIMIRPDTLAEGLKATTPEKLFSPYALPDIEVNRNDKMVTVSLKGVGIFNRRSKATDYQTAESGYISAWYLDEDYDRDCFVDCQSFFDVSYINLKEVVQDNVPTQELKLQTVSRPFPLRGYERIAVKVIDVYGNESTVVKDVA